MNYETYTENTGHATVIYVDHDKYEVEYGDGWVEVDVSGEPNYADPLLCTSEPSNVINEAFLIGCDDNGPEYGGLTFYDFFFFIETNRRK